jgi:hypothetical protein
MAGRMTTAIVLFVLGAVAYLWIFPAMINDPRPSGFLPSTFPRAIALVVGSFSLAEALWLGWRRWLRDDGHPSSNVHPDKFDIRSEVRPALVFATLFVYWIGLRLLGYWIPTAATLITMMKIYGADDWKKVVTRSVVGTIAIFILTDTLLPLSLP